MRSFNNATLCGRSVAKCRWECSVFGPTWSYLFLQHYQKSLLAPDAVAQGKHMHSADPDTNPDSQAARSQHALVLSPDSRQRAA